MIGLVNLREGNPPASLHWPSRRASVPRWSRPTAAGVRASRLQRACARFVRGRIVACAHLQPGLSSRDSGPDRGLDRRERGARPNRAWPGGRTRLRGLPAWKFEKPGGGARSCRGNDKRGKAIRRHGQPFPGRMTLFSFVMSALFKAAVLLRGPGDWDRGSTRVTRGCACAGPPSV